MMNKAMENLKQEAIKETELDKKLARVNGDTGALTPRDYGYLGGTMSKKLTEMGKDLYRRDKYE